MKYYTNYSQVNFYKEITIKSSFYDEMRFKCYYGNNIAVIKTMIMDHLLGKDIKVNFDNIVLANKNGKLENNVLLQDINQSDVLILSIVPINCDIQHN